MTIPAWYTSRATYNAGDGSSNAGSLYSFGTTGSSDRALGDVGSGGTGTILAATRLVNNTGATITSLDISFVGEQWRSGGSSTATPSVAQTVDFQYQVASAGVVTDANVPATAGWVDYNPLDFTSPKFGTTTPAALNGNDPTNRVALSSTLTVNVAPGQEIWLRWLDIDHSNNDHGMAVDDFSVTANGAGATNPSGVGSANPGSVLAGGTTLLTVATTGGTSPVSTGLGVTADLTSIGGNAAQPLYDDGTHGDAAAGDKTFSFSATVSNAASGGAKSLPFTVTDAQSRSGGGSIALTVLTPTSPSGTGSAAPGTVQAGGSSLLTVAVTPGANPASTGLSVTGDLSSIGGNAAQQFFDNGTHGDATAGDNTFSYSATVSLATASGIKNLPVQLADAQGRTGAASISLSVTDAPVLPGALVISQVYGGGGNSGATYKNDFIEIFNRGTQPVNLAGWSVQYGSSGGTSWTRTPLTSFILQPGQYYLVQEAAGSGGTVNLPTPDAVGTIAMSGTAAKVALVRNNANLSGSTCSEWLADPDLIDFVGYGTASNCFAGAAPAPTLSNTTAALRTRNGCKDSDADSLDFVERAPAPRNSSAASNVCPVGDLPPEVYSTNPGDGGTNFPLAGNLTVTFDMPVNVTDGAFTLSCETSGAHTVAVSGGPTVFTLNPDADLLSGEQCTAQVLASHVSSQATTPVPMAADYVWTFAALVVRNPADHLVMGNPSGAVAEESQPLNYLMMKPQYALSYNNDRGIPNWTSWHLDSTWTTSVADRQNDFRADSSLPASFKHVQSGYNFSTYGFDRGHMTPSADRTSSVEDNSATFLMTNMIPQASGNNQGPWNNLEGHIRTLLNGSANEIYIVSGGAGVGGNSTTGHWNTIQDTGGNTVTVPQHTWKVVMVLPRANGDDVARVNTSTRTFAVIMPNDDNIREHDWKKYLATVNQVEALTGYDFFSNVPDEIEAVIEAQLDAEYDTAPVANSQSVTTPEDTQKSITLSASDFNVNNAFTYTVVGGPAHGQLSGTGGALTYTPFADYSGPDSFTFKVNDGSKDSNVATVTINVTAVNDNPVALDDTAATDEDTPVGVNVLANDTDVEGDGLSVSSVTQGAHGSVTVTGGGAGVSYSPAPDYVGGDSFTYTVSDGHGGEATASVSVTVRDTTAPALNVPAGVTAEATSGAGAVVTYTVSASDNSGVAPSVQCSAPSGSLFPIGMTTVNCQATDGSGYTSTASFGVTVRDTTAPALSLPATIIREATSAAGAGVSFAATASDAVSGNFPANCAPASGGLFAVGQTTVNCSATDGAGNTSTGSFLVYVTPFGASEEAAPVQASDDAPPVPLTVEAPGGQALNLSLDFGQVTTPGVVTVEPIADPAQIGAIPQGFAVSNLVAFQIDTTAVFESDRQQGKGVVIAFVVPPIDANGDGVDDIDAAAFGQLTVLHSNNGTLEELEVTNRDFAARTIYAKTYSFSPFYLARKVTRKVAPLFDTTRAHKAGSTIPVKVKVLNSSTGQNLSSSSLPVTVRGIRLDGAPAAVSVQDSGNANPDYGFRFVAAADGGSYIYNLSTKGLAPGHYVLSIYIGNDRSFFHTVTFDVR